MNPMKKIILFIYILLSPLCASAKDLVAEEIRRIEISAEIAEMVGPDQAIRFGGNVALKKGINWKAIAAHPHFRRKLAKIDSHNAKKIKVIIKNYGWPRISEFGEYTARNTWLLVQHMDSDVEFQTKILWHMKPLLDANEAIKADYALLFDRVQVNKGKLQLYGSQGGCVGKEWQPKPIENPEEVDRRRKEMGLPPMEEYKQMFKDVCL